MKEFDNFFFKQKEPNQSCLLALKDIILKQDKSIVSAWKYGMPFFCYQDKMFCYLWFHKKFQQPYIGFVEGQFLDHPDLLAEKRSRMKILLINPERDIPVKKISQLVKLALTFYSNPKA